VMCTDRLFGSLIFAEVLGYGNRLMKDIKWRQECGGISNGIYLTL